MFQSSTTPNLPKPDIEIAEQSRSESYNWRKWAKAGLVFAGTVGAFLALKTTESFSLISSWLRGT